MEPGSTGQLIALLILLLFSAFFSMSETALTSLSRIRLRFMVGEGMKGAAMAEKVLADPKKLLTTILIGNNIANLSASSLTTLIAIKLFGGANIWIGVFSGLLTLVILVFGEITPKSFAVANCERISMLVARPIYIFMLIFSPITYVFNRFSTGFIKLLGGKIESSSPIITEDELKTVVTVSHEEGVLEVEERQMINNVFDFGDYCAKDLMTPRTDITALSVDSTAEEIREVFMSEQFSRLPVYKDSTDNIVGILHLKDFIFHNTGTGFNIESCMREPFFTYEAKPASQLFILMRTKRISMAIVIDEYGGTSGLITLEDLIEEIVGDISDEYDEFEKEIERVEENEYIIDGSMKISDVNEIFGTQLESDDFDSIGGYVTGVIGHIPVKGDFVSFNKIKLIIEKIDKNRVEKLRVMGTSCASIQ